MPRAVLSLDQGTTSSRAILFGENGLPLAVKHQEFPQVFPQPGWVEHNPEDIWQSQLSTAQHVMQSGAVSVDDVVAIGITNQRETTIVWDRTTGEPVYNAIVWQDRRTADYCDHLKAEGWSERVAEKTGLIIDPYFSGTKLRWILENVESVRQRAEQGDLAFGTVDSYLIWRLTGGKVHMIDYSNASRTMLFNINSLEWDDDVLNLLGIPKAMLPDVKESSAHYGDTDPEFFGRAIPIAGDAGDQQAASFGQALFDVGMAKQTYGTGGFLLMNIGDQPKPSSNGMLTTIAWSIDGKPTYAFEGAIFIAGAAVQWLRDSLQIVDHAEATEQMAMSIDSSGEVYVVPAFTGLGAPYWNPYARATILGLSRGTGRAEIVRATLESVAYQTRDVLDAMQQDLDLGLKELRVDGGMVANDFLMQFQADIIGKSVLRPEVPETTALGAAYLAGLAVGFWDDLDHLKRNWLLDKRYEPAMSEPDRAASYKGWKRAVNAALVWADDRD